MRGKKTTIGGDVFNHMRYPGGSSGMHHRRTPRSLSVLPLAISFAVIAATCGAATMASAATKQSAKAPIRTQIANDKRQIHKYLAKPKFRKPGPSLAASKLKGKTIMAVVTDEAVPVLEKILQGVEAAGAAAGLKVEPFDGNGSVTTKEKGIQEAVTQHMAGIITIGIESSTIEAALATAKKANIPVVAIAGQKPNDRVPHQGAGPNDFGEIALNYGLMAQLTTEDAIVRTRGKVKAALLGFPNNANSTWESGFVKATLAKCKGCKLLQTDTIPVPKWSTTVTPETESLLREFPTLNTIITCADSQAIFAAEGIKIAGATGHVHVYTIDGSTGAALKAVETGKVVVADPGGSGLSIGWAGVDQLLRGMLKMKPANSFSPFRFLDSANARGNVTSTTVVYGTNFVRGFKKLWGV